MTHSPDEIRRAAQAVQTVKGIDDTIKTMGAQVDRIVVATGEAARREIGRNLLSQLTNDHLGEVVFCGVVNALLRKRARIVQEHSAMVTFPCPPCAEQFPASESET